MSLADQVTKEERALGRWPRRLLHVPTMTSHEWQPGNVYGGAQSPEYNAITYTWGRWKLAAGQMVLIRAVDIRGVAWEIPRVNPSHFTAAEFQDVIHAAVTEPLAAGGVQRKLKPPTEYLWLDVACIDQRPHEPRSASEIGRQAEIFKGARDVFAWLPSFRHQRLQPLLIEIRELGFRLAELPLDDSFLGPVPDGLYSCFQKLFGDPWFSSLWTLQEIFLRQEAVFLSRDAKTVIITNPESSSSRIFDFLDLVGVCEQLRVERLTATNRKLRGSLAGCACLADEVGLSAIMTQNAIMALAASARRQTLNDADRVYGIQQIFGFRLGATAPGAASRGVLPRSQLEAELGRELLSAYPVHSQAHVFSKPVALGQGWRVNVDSIVPDSGVANGNPVFPYKEYYDVSTEDGAIFSAEFMKTTAPKVSMSVVDIGGQTWGTFNGCICPLAILHAQAVHFEQHPLVQHLFMAKDSAAYSRSVFNVHLDASTNFPGCPETLSSGYHNTWNGSQQRSLTLWLSENHQPSDLVVLLLGPIVGDGETFMYGLLLLGPPARVHAHSCWRRVGFCNWKTDCMTIGGEKLPGYEFFFGLTSDWVTTTGVFG